MLIHSEEALKLVHERFINTKLIVHSTLSPMHANGIRWNGPLVYKGILLGIRRVFDECLDFSSDRLTTRANGQRSVLERESKRIIGLKEGPIDHLSRKKSNYVIRFFELH